MRSSQEVVSEHGGFAKIAVGVVWTDVAWKGELLGWNENIDVGAAGVFKKLVS